jgi:hypothetical protein
MPPLNPPWGEGPAARQLSHSGHLEGHGGGGEAQQHHGYCPREHFSSLKATRSKKLALTTGTTKIVPTRHAIVNPRIVFFFVEGSKTLYTWLAVAREARGVT